ncbi:MAG: peptidase S26 family protein [Phenylobacterium sp.]|nr:peptidase S26 family protein [Phenylobacterium sp.]
MGLSALALASQSGFKLAIVNESPSLPKGLYLRLAGTPGVGDVVALRPPALARPYLAQLGTPKNVLLLKRVAAVEGDVVCASGRRVSTPRRGVLLHGHDSQGRQLPAWRGCRSLGPGQVFLLGDSADSFDARYFGPVHRAELKGRFLGVLTW